jgi:hypothetical protein
MSLYSFVLTTHILTAIGLIVVVIYSDHLGWQWLRGKQQTLNLTTLNRLHHIIYAGLSIMVTTGLYMFWPLQAYLLYEPAFYVKMGFVGTLIINSFFIGSFMRKASETPFNLLSKQERVPLYVSGALSTVVWLGTIVAATQLGL